MRWLWILPLPLLAVSCLVPSSEAPFDGSQASPVQVIATVMIEQDSPPPPQESDTVHPDDSLIFQGNFTPNRYLKTLDHWWTIDGVPITDEYYLKWSFQESGRHDAIFFVLDQFGDTLRDTAVVWVNSPPRLDSTASPGHQTWGIPSASTKGLRFSWFVQDPDPGAILQHRFQISRSTCASGLSDTLLLDTLLSHPDFIYWPPLDPLCLYHWQIQVQDEFLESSESAPQWTFSTASQIGLGAVLFHNDSTHVRTELFRLGDTLRTQFGGSSPVIFSDLAAGEYRLTLEDTLHRGFSSRTVRFTLGTGQLLHLGSLNLSDGIAPVILCPQCTGDTLISTLPFVFPLHETGCGIDSAQISVYLDGSPHPWKFKSDTLRVNPVEYPLVMRTHPLEMRVGDRCGNLAIVTKFIRRER